MARRIGAIRLQFGNHHLESKGVECEGEKRQRWLEDAANAPKSCVHLRCVLSERRKGDESDVADSVAELKFLPTRLALAVEVRPSVRHRTWETSNKVELRLKVLLCWASAPLCTPMATGRPSRPGMK